MILIALGANLPSRYGQPEETFLYAKHEMSGRGMRVVAESNTWSTAPVPMSDQPWYRNEVVVVETDFGAEKILGMLKEIEHNFGRADITRDAPRVLDLDLLACGNQVLDQENLIVPHPRMHDRGFVLYPLQEVVPNWIHPVLKRSIDDLIQDLPKDQVVKLLKEEAA